MKSLRFLQISDLHLDSTLAGSKLNLPPTKQKTIRNDIRRVVRQLPDIVKKYSVEVVLCPGDMWEEEAVRLETAIEFFETLRSIAPIPVLIAPGNHDFYHPLSYYSQEYYERKSGKEYPSNLFVFSQPEITTLALPQLPGVEFFGSCFTAFSSVGIHPAFVARQGRPDTLKVALVHGSLLDSPLQVESKQKRDSVLTFSSRDILSSAYDYIALGHYHRYEAIEDRSKIRAAYGGIPVARGLDETRAHYVLVGEIQHGGVSAESLEPICVDERRIHDLEIFLDGQAVTAGQILTTIKRELDEADVQKNDIVYARLKGKLPASYDEVDVDTSELEKLCFHIVLDWAGVEPDYDLDAMRRDVSVEKTVLGQFIREMDRLEEAAQASADFRRVKVIQEARILGLDALHGKELCARHVAQ